MYGHYTKLLNEIEPERRDVEKEVLDDQASGVGCGRNPGVYREKFTGRGHQDPEIQAKKIALP